MTILLLILLVVYFAAVSAPVAVNLVALIFVRNGADLRSDGRQPWITPGMTLGRGGAGPRRDSHSIV